MLRIRSLLTAIALFAAPTLALGGSPLDTPYEGATGKPSCGNPLKVLTMKDTGSGDFQPLDVLLVADGINPASLKYRFSMMTATTNFRADDSGYLLAIFECKYAGGVTATEVQVGIKKFPVDGVEHFGTRIFVHKSVIANKAGVTVCLPNLDGKYYRYVSFWDKQKGTDTPVLIIKRPDGNPACMTRTS